ncbi:MAG TPA: hypothetical protein VLD19_12240, partial [Chitinophagaceae bacterium]|nr:hypothetical protein [Chitinophagaceae bacterium]
MHCLFESGVVVVRNSLPPPFPTYECNLHKNMQPAQECIPQVSILKPGIASVYYGVLIAKINVIAIFFPVA